MSIGLTIDRLSKQLDSFSEVASAFLQEKRKQLLAAKEATSVVGDLAEGWKPCIYGIYVGLTPMH